MMQRRLKEKIVSAVADFTDFDETFAPGADTLFVTELYSRKMPGRQSRDLSVFLNTA
jgi:hypothetical protein